MKNNLIKSLSKTGIVFIVLAFLMGMVYVLGWTVPSTRGGIHYVAQYIFMGSLAERLLPMDHALEEPEVVAAAEPAREISFSPVASKNIGIDDSTIAKIEVIDYYKSLILPAVVTERPGHSTIDIPSPVSGVVTKIYHEAGVVVLPGEALFDIFLNHPDIVKIQNDYIALLKTKEINDAEIDRLSDVGNDILPQKKRELTYERERLQVEISSQKRALELQGLSLEQISESLEKKREIVKNMTVHVPLIADENESQKILTMDQLNVNVGQNIVLGDPLCRLSDLNQLVVKGKVFAVDEKKITQAITEKRNVSAVFGGNDRREIIDGLHIRSVDNRVDQENGIIYCYVDLNNKFAIHDANQDENDKRRYVQWQFRPGERCELQVEYEELPKCIVLPVDAVAQDISEMCVFEWVGNEDDKKIWRKTPVHVLFKTKDVVVIANDGSIFPGAMVATKGAGFILAALDASNQKVAGGGGIQHGDHVH